MKENYLHDKIRKQQDELSFLKTKYDDLIREVNQLQNFKKSIMEEVYKSFDIYINKLKDANITEMENYVGNRWQNIYNELHGLISSELRIINKSNKQLLERFCEEILFQRRDLGMIMSVILVKGIISEKELKELNKKMIKDIEEKGMKKKIRDEFMPIIMSEDKARKNELWQ